MECASIHISIDGDSNNSYKIFDNDINGSCLCKGACIKLNDLSILKNVQISYRESVLNGYVMPSSISIYAGKNITEYDSNNWISMDYVASFNGSSGLLELESNNKIYNGYKIAFTVMVLYL